MILCAAIQITFIRASKTVEAVIPGQRRSSCCERMATSQPRLFEANGSCTARICIET